MARLFQMVVAGTAPLVLTVVIQIYKTVTNAAIYTTMYRFRAKLSSNAPYSGPSSHSYRSRAKLRSNATYSGPSSQSWFVRSTVFYRILSQPARKCQGARQRVLTAVLNELPSAGNRQYRLCLCRKCMNGTSGTCLLRLSPTK